ncbi:MAG: hypothetical protein K2Q11_08395 [Burkholderiaceae bacterium]|nr:hypothetical protein [Burkholderiaceae bacterium]
MKNSYLVCSLALLLSACASTPQYAYVREHTDNYQRDNDLSKCQYQVRLQKTPHEETRELVRLCMQGKGYRLRRIN